MNVPQGFLEGEIRDGFYVESMMKKTWAAQLEVLNDVDKICRKHDIQYFADWGTLLGAIRHKGFIPWDDDMDITMKHQDLIKFCDVVSQEMKGYEIVNLHTDPGWNSLITRIVNTRRIRFDDEHLNKFHGCPWAIGLDIFPLDYVAPAKEDDEFQCNVIKIITFFAENLKSDQYDKEDIKKNAEEIEKMCGVKFNDKEPLRKQLLKLAEQLCMMYSEEEATQIALMPDHAGPRPNDVYPKEYYSDSIYVPFEYTTIPVPVGYEPILKQKYGEDYMTPIIGASSHDYPFYRKQKRELYAQMGIKI